MSPVQVGVCLLPELPWARDAPRWREADAAGFSTLWTYDHLSWRSLRDGPWYGALPLLTAAAGVTSRARLGTLVASPNFRHPVLLAKDVMTLDGISDGRFDLGLGSGGTGADATVLGSPPLPAAQRMDRFLEFVDLLDRLLSHPATSFDGRYYRVTDARLVPGCVQRPRVPFTVAATGPRGLAVAAATASTWVTFGPGREADGEPGWWRGVLAQRDRLDAECEALGRDPTGLRRTALVPLDTAWPQASPAAWDDFVGRLGDRRFTDVVVHWPRPDDPALPGPPTPVFDHIVGGLPRG